LILLILLFFQTQTFFIGNVTAQEVGGGPRVDNILIKLYPTFEAAIQAFEADEIDFLDMPLNSTLISKYSGSPWNTIVSLDPVSELAMFEIDINNNETLPTYTKWSSPTSYQAFRHALAHLTDKSRYVNEILGGNGTELNTPVMPWMTKWYNSVVDPHTYNRTEAAVILDGDGFADSNGDGIRDYPIDHIKSGQNLDPVLFFAPSEDSVRLVVAQLLTYEMQLMGIPVNLTVTNWTNIFQSVIKSKDFHLYIGKQDMYRSDVSEDTAANNFANLYHSGMYGTYGSNYVYFNNTQFDSYVQMLWQSSNETTAITASKEAQRILAEEIGIVPLFAVVGYKVHKTQWVDTVNENGNGVDNWWTFMLTSQKDIPSGGTLRYGVVGDPGDINPLRSSLNQITSFTELIYDSLLRVRNLDSVVSGVAKNWEVDTWFNPDIGANATKLTFYLNENFYFHDGVQLTSADVNFTLAYLRKNPIGVNYAKVMDIHHVETPNPYTVVVYENTPSMWALGWIGSIPIIPKHKWESIADPFVPTPEPTVTGSGPFKFVEYIPGNYISLTANRNYPQHDVAIVQISTSPSPLVADQPIYINVTVENQRNFTEIIIVSTYYTRLFDPLIGTQNVTIGPGANATLTFEWTPDLAGRYEIQAEADTVVSEVDSDDNTIRKVVFVESKVGSQRSGSSEPSSLNSIAFIFGLLSAAFIIPKLHQRKRILENNAIHSLNHKSIQTRKSLWQELIKRQSL